MKSMTSYAYLDGVVGNTDICCELKSYNARFLDLTINVPSTMTQLEPFLRKYFSHHIARGKVDFYMRIQKLHDTEAVIPNIALAKAYYKSIAAIAGALGLERNIPLELILQREGVLQIDKSFDADLWQKELTPILDTLIENFNHCRIEEGRALASDMQKMLTILSDSVTEIERHGEHMEELFCTMLKKNVPTL